MKTICLLLISLILSASTLAQNKLFESLTKEFAENDGFSASQISNDMFDLYLKKRNIGEDSPVFDALKNLDNILVASQTGSFMNWGEEDKEEEKKTDAIEKMHHSILDYYDDNNYSLFKTRKQMGEDLKVFLKKDGKQIHALALVTKSPAKTTLVELQGQIDLTSVSQLNQALNLKGLENLYKINGESESFMHGMEGHFYFPHERIAEMEERQRAIGEHQKHLTEEQQKEIEEKARAMAEKQREWAEQYREMAEKYNRQPIFLNYPGDKNTIYYINDKKVEAGELKKLDSQQILTIDVKKSEDGKENTIIRITTKK